MTIIFWVSLALLAASIEPIIVKLGYAGNASPLQLLAAKSIVGGLMILPFTRTLRWIGWKAFTQVAFLALLWFTTHAFTLLALKHISAVCLITVATTTPAFVAILNQRLGRDVLGGKFWLGFLLCFIGVVAGLDVRDNICGSVGLALVLITVASSTFYRIRAESVTEYLEPALVSTYIFLINGVVGTVSILPFVGTISASTWLFGGWMGLAAAAANVAFVFALSILGSTRMSIIHMLQRPLVIILAALVLGESMSLFQMLGFLLVLGGIKLATVKRASKDHSRQPPLPITRVASECSA